MRVVKGIFGGKCLSIPNLPDYVRPTSNYAKEGIFNILEHNFGIADKKVLELFSGTGSIGLEFLSLQAAQVTMVERSDYMCRSIRKWIKELNLTDEHAIVHKQDVLQFLKQTQESHFDFIFADPPFNQNYAPQILGLIKEKSLLASGGVFVYECSTHTRQEELSIQDWTYTRVVSYGDIKVYFYYV